MTEACSSILFCNSTRFWLSSMLGNIRSQHFRMHCRSASERAGQRASSNRTVWTSSFAKSSLSFNICDHWDLIIDNDTRIDYVSTVSQVFRAENMRTGQESHLPPYNLFFLEL